MFPERVSWKSGDRLLAAGLLAVSADGSHAAYQVVGRGVAHYVVASVAELQEVSDG